MSLPKFPAWMNETQCQGCPEYGYCNECAQRRFRVWFKEHKALAIAWIELEAIGSQGCYDRNCHKDQYAREAMRRISELASSLRGDWEMIRVCYSDGRPSTWVEQKEDNKMTFTDDDLKRLKKTWCGMNIPMDKMQALLARLESAEKCVDACGCFTPEYEVWRKACGK